jgi:arginyl-tRNA synthetase
VYEGFEQTYQNLGVHFDKFDYESETYKRGKEIVKEGLEKEVFYRVQNGSVWVDLSDYDLDQKLLLRPDGTSVYITQDLGTADDRYRNFKMNRCIYVVGSEQNYHFKVLRAILDKLEKSYADGIYHLSYGMIHLPSGKMKSREGTVVDADDLIQEMIDTARGYTQEYGQVDELKKDQAARLYKTIGLGALKFHLLKVEPKKEIMFDPKETIDFQGHTGPFIQYSYARIQSVLRKFKAQFKELEPDIEAEKYEDPLPQERELIMENAKLPKAIEDAADQYAPSIIVNYSYQLAKLYNQFYAEVPILNADETVETGFRLQLSKLTAQTISQAMELLGIDLPERM